MNYYLVECENPSEQLRLYKNSRVANYTCDELNTAAGFKKYMITNNDELITIRFKGSVPFEGVNPYK